MKLSVLAMLLLTFDIPAQGDISDIVCCDTLNLNEIVVTGTRVPKLLKDSPVQTILITSKDIERANAANIEELLQSEMPGVEFSYSMNQQVHLNFGGFGGQNVLFLINGERMAGETMDDVDFSRLDMNNVERIEIVRGASSALYGSNAGGGVINIITKEAVKICDLNIDARFGDHAQRQYMLGIGTNCGKVVNNLSATASRMNNYDVKNEADPITRVVSTIYGYKTFNIREQLIWRPFSTLKVSARAGFYMREIPRDADAPERYRSYSAGLRGEWDFSSIDKLEISYTFDQYDKSNYRILTGYDIRNYSNVQNSVRGLYNHNFANGDVLTVGADYMHDYLFNTRVIGKQKRQDNYDFFVQYDWSPNKRWEIVATTRYDYFSDGSLSHVSPKLSVRFSPGYRLNLRASYGTGFRAPTLKEKYYEFDMAGIWIVKGNPGLKPELSHNFNISADYTKGQYNITAMAYYNHIINRITTGLPYSISGDNGQLYLDYINLDNFHSFGSELAVQSAWRCGLSARISYAYIYEHSIRDPDGKSANNGYMPSRPHSLTARINWTKSFSKRYSFDIVLNGRFLSSVGNYEYQDYYDLSRGTVKVTYPGYMICKLSTTQTFFNKLKLTLAIDNLLNYKPKYYYLNSPLTDGINLKAAISLKI